MGGKTKKSPSPGLKADDATLGPHWPFYLLTQFSSWLVLTVSYNERVVMVIARKSAISRSLPYTPLGVKLANSLAGGIISYQRKCRNRRGQVANGRGQLSAIARAKNTCKPFAALQVKKN